MEKMKYNISARTTILIGREGVSRADGAIIELIKNTYDADADFCYIAFDPTSAERKRLKACPLSRSQTQLCIAVTCKRCADENDSGLAWSF